MTRTSITMKMEVTVTAITATKMKVTGIKKVLMDTNTDKVVNNITIHMINTGKKGSINITNMDMVTSTTPMEDNGDLTVMSMDTKMVIVGMEEVTMDLTVVSTAMETRTTPMEDNGDLTVMSMDTKMAMAGMEEVTMDLTAAGMMGMVGTQTTDAE